MHCDESKQTVMVGTPVSNQAQKLRYIGKGHYLNGRPLMVLAWFHTVKDTYRQVDSVNPGLPLVVV